LRKPEIRRLFREEVDVSRNGSRTVTRGASAPAPVKPSAAKVQRVVIDDFTREKLISQVINTADGRETGGPLLGVIAGDAIHIRQSFPLAYECERSPESFMYDLQYAREIAEAHNTGLVGDFHSHSAGVLPSPADRKSWTSHRSGWVGVIVALNVDERTGWPHPQLAAYLVSDGDIDPVPLESA
jgi:hypothetical protein